jgi:hypothetical protein
LAQVVTVHAGKQVGIDDIPRSGFQYHLLVRGLSIGFLGGNKARAHIHHVHAQRLGGGDLLAFGYRPCQHQRAIVKLPDLRHKGERVEPSRMTACPMADQNQPIYPGIDGFSSVPQRGHVVKYQAAISVHLFDYPIGRMQAGDDQWHLELSA